MYAWRWFACAAFACCTACATDPEPAPPLGEQNPPEQVGYVDVNGLHLVSEQILNPRLRELTFSTAAVQQHYATPPSPSVPQQPTPVELTRAVDEFSTLSVEGSRGFTLAGSGSAQVTTGALFTPGGSYSLTVEDARGSETYTVSADADGRIATRALALGPDNAYPQYTGGTTNVFTATVRIAPL